MKLQRRLPGYVLTLLLLSTGTSFAAHPLVSDDAGTLGKGGIQIELNGDISTDKETVAGSTAKNDGSQIATTFGYGISDKLDVSFGIARPWGNNDLDGIKSRDPGSVDLVLGMKWQIYENDGFTVAVKPGLGYSYTVNAPDSDYATSYSAALVLSKELEPLAFHLNVGYAYNDYNLANGLRNSIWNFSGATTYEIVKNMKLVADIGAGTNEESGTNNMPAFALIGTIYTLSKNMDASVGGKIGLTRPETDFTGTFGLTFKF